MKRIVWRVDVSVFRYFAGTQVYAVANDGCSLCKIG
jgi:hypothetical protein